MSPEKSLVFPHGTLERRGLYYANINIKHPQMHPYLILITGCSNAGVDT
jgi:hypothetical protein